MDRVISLLAALVGLIALAGAVLVQVHSEDERRQLVSELAEMRLTLEQAGQPVVAPAVEAANDGTVEGLLALQKRVAALEQAAKDQAAVIAAIKTLPAPVADAGAATDTPRAAMTGPSTDCIPLDTRFMAQPGDSIAICNTPQVITVTDISQDMVTLEEVGAVVTGGFSKIGFSDCNVMVFSADPAGFAEMRVNCK